MDWFMIATWIGKVVMWIVGVIVGFSLLVGAIYWIATNFKTFLLNVFALGLLICVLIYGYSTNWGNDPIEQANNTPVYSNPQPVSTSNDDSLLDYYWYLYPSMASVAIR